MTRSQQMMMVLVAQTFAVDAGAGDDLPIVADAADINTADEQGRYTN